MCQVTLLNLSTGICSNPRLIALYYRNRVGVGEGLGRVILNTKEGARERPKGCWALVPAAAHRPIQVAKRCGTYAATLLSRLICTYRESMALTLRLVVCAVRTVCFDVKHKEDASTTLSCRQFCILVLFLKVSSSVPVMLAQMTIRLMT